MKGKVIVLSSKTNIEITKMRKQNAKLVFKKVVAGILAIFMVGVIAFILLFLVMLIM